MRRSRREPAPRTSEEREAARAERARRRTARHGERPPTLEPDLGREAGIGSLAAEPLTPERGQWGDALDADGAAEEHELWGDALDSDGAAEEHELWGDAPDSDGAADALRRGFEPDEPEYDRAAELETPLPVDAPEATSRRARNTAIFSVLTGLSRVAGLGREIVARSYFGTSGPMSAFTLAFQVPNLIRALVADAALSSAFVPVFSELLENKRRREALLLATSLAGLLLVALTALTLGFILLAPVIMPLFTGDESTAALDALTVGLSQVLFPIVVLLGLNGLVVGILNAHEHFTIPALAPLVWNLVIIGGLVGLTPMFEGDNQVYGYAIGVLAGTTVQLAMCLVPLRKLGYPIKFSFRWRGNARVRQVLLLMLPVSLGLGLINVSLLVNSTIGFLVSDEAPAAIDAAFRIYMLPQGMFSVAVATVLFPVLSRLATRRDAAGLRAHVGSGMRQISLLLIPSAAVFIALAEPITRLVYQRGDFDAHSTAQASEALFWFAFSLPVSGITLLLTRTFFSLQRPWLPTRLACYSIVVNIAVSYALHDSMGIGGIVLGTTISNIVLTVLEARVLRRGLGGLELGRTARALLPIAGASALLGLVAYFVWDLLDGVLGRSFPAQLVSVGVALALGGVLYVAVLLRSGLPEARQIYELFARRFRRGAS